MRIGIFGDGADPQCAAVAREAAALGVDSLYVDSRALDEGRPLSMLDGRTFYLGELVDDVRGFYLRGIPVRQIQDIAAAGVNMPPKSTYFFPKVPTGLLFNPLSDPE